MGGSTHLPLPLTNSSLEESSSSPSSSLPTSCSHHDKDERDNSRKSCTSASDGKDELLFQSAHSVHSNASVLTLLSTGEFFDDDSESSSFEGEDSFALLGEDEIDDEAYEEQQRTIATQMLDSIGKSKTKSSFSRSHLFKRMIGKSSSSSAAATTLTSVPPSEFDLSIIIEEFSGSVQVDSISTLIE